jgi:hypothetical protein
MSFSLKVATVAALTFSALAAVMASDTTLADESAPVAHVPGAAPALSYEISSPAPAHTNVAAASPRAVSFAPSREVVQPLAMLDTDAISSRPAASLGALVAGYDRAPELDEQGRCLAGAIYFEAKSESLAGQLAVAHVVINRARSGRFASSLCGVVHQPGQFSFVRGGTIPTVNTSSRDWTEAAAIARIAMEGAVASPAEGALYFHARRVSPGWGRPRVAVIDNHIFYR